MYVFILPILIELIKVKPSEKNLAEWYDLML